MKCPTCHGVGSIRVVLSMSHEDWPECSTCKGKGTLPDPEPEPEPPPVYKWWCVCDKEEPDYGAHMVLATTQEEALQEGCRRWYDEVGEYADTVVAVEVPVPVTEEHLNRAGKT